MARGGPAATPAPSDPNAIIQAIGALQASNEEQQKLNRRQNRELAKRLVEVKKLLNPSVVPRSLGSEATKLKRPQGYSTCNASSVLRSLIAAQNVRNLSAQGAGLAAPALNQFLEGTDDAFVNKESKVRYMRFCLDRAVDRFDTVDSSDPNVIASFVSA